MDLSVPSDDDLQWLMERAGIDSLNELANGIQPGEDDKTTPAGKRSRRLTAEKLASLLKKARVSSQLQSPFSFLERSMSPLTLNESGAASVKDRTPELSKFEASQLLNHLRAVDECQVTDDRLAALLRVNDEHLASFHGCLEDSNNGENTTLLNEMMTENNTPLRIKSSRIGQDSSADTIAMPPPGSAVPLSRQKRKPFRRRNNVAKDKTTGSCNSGASWRQSIVAGSLDCTRRVCSPNGSTLSSVTEPLFQSTPQKEGIFLKSEELTLKAEHEPNMEASAQTFTSTQKGKRVGRRRGNTSKQNASDMEETIRGSSYNSSRPQRKVQNTSSDSGPSLTSQTGLNEGPHKKTRPRGKGETSMASHSHVCDSITLCEEGITDMTLSLLDEFQQTKDGCESGETDKSLTSKSRTSRRLRSRKTRRNPAASPVDITLPFEFSECSSLQITNEIENSSKKASKVSQSANNSRIYPRSEKVTQTRRSAFNASKTTSVHVSKASPASKFKARERRSKSRRLTAKKLIMLLERTHASSQLCPTTNNFSIESVSELSSEREVGASKKGRSTDLSRIETKRLLEQLRSLSESGLDLPVDDELVDMLGLQDRHLASFQGCLDTDSETDEVDATDDAEKTLTDNQSNDENVSNVKTSQPSPRSRKIDVQHVSREALTNITNSTVNNDNRGQRYVVEGAAYSTQHAASQEESFHQSQAGPVLHTTRHYHSETKQNSINLTIPSLQMEQSTFRLSGSVGDQSITLPDLSGTVTNQDVSESFCIPKMHSDSDSHQGTKENSDVTVVSGASVMNTTELSSARSLRSRQKASNPSISSTTSQANMIMETSLAEILSKNNTGTEITSITDKNKDSSKSNTSSGSTTPLDNVLPKSAIKPRQRRSKNRRLTAEKLTTLLKRARRSSCLVNDMSLQSRSALKNEEGVAESVDVAVTGLSRNEATQVFDRLQSMLASGLDLPTEEGLAAMLGLRDDQLASFHGCLSDSDGGEEDTLCQADDTPTECEPHNVQAAAANDKGGTQFGDKLKYLEGEDLVCATNSTINDADFEHHSVIAGSMSNTRGIASMKQSFHLSTAVPAAHSTRLYHDGDLPSSSCVGVESLRLEPSTHEITNSVPGLSITLPQVDGTITNLNMSESFCIPQLRSRGSKMTGNIIDWSLPPRNMGTTLAPSPIIQTLVPNTEDGLREGMRVIDSNEFQQKASSSKASSSQEDQARVHETNLGDKAEEDTSEIMASSKMISRSKKGKNKNQSKSDECGARSDISVASQQSMSQNTPDISGPRKLRPRQKAAELSSSTSLLQSHLGLRMKPSVMEKATAIDTIHGCASDAIENKDTSQTDRGSYSTTCVANETSSSVKPRQRCSKNRRLTTERLSTLLKRACKSSRPISAISLQSASALQNVVDASASADFSVAGLSQVEATQVFDRLQSMIASGLDLPTEDGLAAMLGLRDDQLASFHGCLNDSGDEEDTIIQPDETLTEGRYDGVLFSADEEKLTSKLAGELNSLNQGNETGIIHSDRNGDDFQHGSVIAGSNMHSRGLTSMQQSLHLYTAVPAVHSTRLDVARELSSSSCMEAASLRLERSTHEVTESLAGLSMALAHVNNTNTNQDVSGSFCVPQMRSPENTLTGNLIDFSLPTRNTNTTSSSVFGESLNQNTENDPNSEVGVSGSIEYQQTSSSESNHTLKGQDGVGERYLTGRDAASKIGCSVPISRSKKKRNNRAKMVEYESANDVSILSQLSVSESAASTSGSRILRSRRKAANCSSSASLSQSELSLRMEPSLMEESKKTSTCTRTSSVCTKPSKNSATVNTSLSSTTPVANGMATFAVKSRQRRSKTRRLTAEKLATLLKRARRSSRPVNDISLQSTSGLENEDVATESGDLSVAGMSRIEATQLVDRLRSMAASGVDVPAVDDLADVLGLRDDQLVSFYGCLSDSGDEEDTIVQTDETLADAGRPKSVQVSAAEGKLASKLSGKLKMNQGDGIGTIHSDRISDDFKHSGVIAGSNLNSRSLASMQQSLHLSTAVPAAHSTRLYRDGEFPGSLCMEATSLRLERSTHEVTESVSGLSITLPTVNDTVTNLNVSESFCVPQLRSSKSALHSNTGDLSLHPRNTGSILRSLPEDTLNGRNKLRAASSTKIQEQILASEGKDSMRDQSVVEEKYLIKMVEQDAGAGGNSGRAKCYVKKRRNKNRSKIAQCDIDSDISAASERSVSETTTDMPSSQMSRSGRKAANQCSAASRSQSQISLCMEPSMTGRSTITKTDTDGTSDVTSNNRNSVKTSASSRSSASAAEETVTSAMKSHHRRSKSHQLTAEKLATLLTRARRSLRPVNDISLQSTSALENEDSITESADVSVAGLSQIEATQLFDHLRSMVASGLDLPTGDGLAAVLGLRDGQLASFYGCLSDSVDEENDTTIQADSVFTERNDDNDKVSSPREDVVSSKMNLEMHNDGIEYRSTYAGSSMNRCPSAKSLHVSTAVPMAHSTRMYNTGDIPSSLCMEAASLRLDRSTHDVTESVAGLSITLPQERDTLVNQDISGSFCVPQMRSLEETLTGQLTQLLPPRNTEGTSESFVVDKSPLTVSVSGEDGLCVRGLQHRSLSNQNMSEAITEISHGLEVVKNSQRQRRKRMKDKQSQCVGADSDVSTVALDQSVSDYAAEISSAKIFRSSRKAANNSCSLQKSQLAPSLCMDSSIMGNSSQRASRLRKTSDTRTVENLSTKTTTPSHSTSAAEDLGIDAVNPSQCGSRSRRLTAEKLTTLLKQARKSLRHNVDFSLPTTSAVGSEGNKPTSGDVSLAGLSQIEIKQMLDHLRSMDVSGVDLPTEDGLAGVLGLRDDQLASFHSLLNESGEDDDSTTTIQEDDTTTDRQHDVEQIVELQPSLPATSIMSESSTFPGKSSERNDGRAQFSIIAGSGEDSTQHCNALSHSLNLSVVEPVLHSTRHQAENNLSKRMDLSLTSLRLDRSANEMSHSVPGMSITLPDLSSSVVNETVSGSFRVERDSLGNDSYLNQMSLTRNTSLVSEKSITLESHANGSESHNNCSAVPKKHMLPCQENCTVREVVDVEETCFQKTTDKTKDIALNASGSSDEECTFVTVQGSSLISLQIESSVTSAEIEHSNRLKSTGIVQSNAISVESFKSINITQGTCENRESVDNSDADSVASPSNQSVPVSHSSNARTSLNSSAVPDNDNSVGEPDENNSYPQAEDGIHSSLKTLSDSSNSTLVSKVRSSVCATKSSIANTSKNVSDVTKSHLEMSQLQKKLGSIAEHRSVLQTTGAAALPGLGDEHLISFQGCLDASEEDSEGTTILDDHTLTEKGRQSRQPSQIKESTLLDKTRTPKCSEVDGLTTKGDPIPKMNEWRRSIVTGNLDRSGRVCSPSKSIGFQCADPLLQSTFRADVPGLQQAQHHANLSFCSELGGTSDMSAVDDGDHVRASTSKSKTGERRNKNTLLLLDTDHSVNSVRFNRSKSKSKSKHLSSTLWAANSMFSSSQDVNKSILEAKSDSAHFSAGLTLNGKDATSMLPSTLDPHAAQSVQKARDVSSRLATVGHHLQGGTNTVSLEEELSSKVPKAYEENDHAEKSLGQQNCSANRPVCSKSQSVQDSVLECRTPARSARKSRSRIIVSSVKKTPKGRVSSLRKESRAADSFRSYKVKSQTKSSGKSKESSLPHLPQPEHDPSMNKDDLFASALDDTGVLSGTTQASHPQVVAGENTSLTANTNSSLKHELRGQQQSKQQTPSSRRSSRANLPPDSPYQFCMTTVADENTLRQNTCLTGASNLRVPIADDARVTSSIHVDLLDNDSSDSDQFTDVEDDKDPIGKSLPAGRPIWFGKPTLQQQFAALCPEPASSPPTMQDKTPKKRRTARAGAARNKKFLPKLFVETRAANKQWLKTSAADLKFTGEAMDEFLEAIDDFEELALTQLMEVTGGRQDVVIQDVLQLLRRAGVATTATQIEMLISQHAPPQTLWNILKKVTEVESVADD